MSNLFVLAFCIAIAFLIWGVASPQSFSKFIKRPMSRRQIAAWFGALACICFIMIGVTAPPQASKVKTDKTPAVQQAELKPKQEPKAKAKPVVRQAIETAPVPFESTTREDATVAKGVTYTATEGIDGVRTLTYEVTAKDGVDTKKLIKEEVTQQPVTKVTVIGAKVAPAPAPARQASNCDPNYSGCVPIDSDVDCASGTGNGPSYVAGPVTVLGADIYRLDSDGDGVGCE